MGILKQGKRLSMERSLKKESQWRNFVVFASAFVWSPISFMLGDMIFICAVYGSDAYFEDGLRLVKHKPETLSTGVKLSANRGTLEFFIVMAVWFSLICLTKTVVDISCSLARRMMGNTTVNRSAIFGTLSVFLFCSAFLIGIISIVPIAWYTEHGASSAVIAGIGFGCVICVASLIFATFGVIGRERPCWPAGLGLVLSIVPGSIGVYMLWKLVEIWHVV